MADPNDKERESGLELDPKWGDNGLLSVVVTDEATGEVRMMAFMNDEAFAKTRETGLVTFYSRRQKKLWTKGEHSGNFLHVKEIRVDCDQDALWIIAKPDGPTCHTEARSCFYRRLVGDRLERL